MQLGTIRIDSGGNEARTAAVRVEGEEVVELGYGDVGELLRADALDDSRKADGARLPLAGVDWAPLVTAPSKILCIGMNYADHIAEMGNEPPAYPTVFSKFTSSLIGANDDIHLPATDVSVMNDWEAELCVVIGSPCRSVTPDSVLDYVAGYTAFNDFSVRDWQKRTSQFLLGKSFEHCSALGPVMTTADVLGDGGGLSIGSQVNGVEKQASNTDQLVFGVIDLVVEISKALTLLPGDLIATGTPGGVGLARTPPEFLEPGDELAITIDQIGEIRNSCVRSA